MDISRAKDFVDSYGRKILASGAVVGSLVASFGALNLMSDEAPEDANAELDQMAEQAESETLEAQIEENRNQLEALDTTESDSETDYSLMGC